MMEGHYIMSNVSSPATLKAGNESNEPSDSLVNATRTMFTNVATYIKGEFDGETTARVKS